MNSLNRVSSWSLRNMTSEYKWCAPASYKESREKKTSFNCTEENSEHLMRTVQTDAGLAVTEDPVVTASNEVKEAVVAVRPGIGVDFIKHEPGIDKF